MISFFRALLVLSVVSGILLVSDLGNRRRTARAAFATGNSSVAVAGKTYNMGFCFFAPEQSHDDLLKGLYTRLEELGYVRGRNLTVKESHCNGEIGNLAQILLSMDNQDLDLIMVTSTPCITASVAAVKKHKVGFTYCSDPIAAGTGKSFNDHNHGITGVGSFPPVEKTIQFILDVVPGVKKIGTIYNNAEANSRSVVSLMRKIAKEKNFILEEVPVVNTSEVFQATQVILGKGIDALYISGDNTAIQAFDAIAGQCGKVHMPLVTNDLPLVTRGALASIGPGWYGVGYHSADKIALLLNGASPDTIPIENFVSEQITVNMEKARELGLVIPQEYLENASGKGQNAVKKLALVHYIDSPNTEDCEAGIRKALLDAGLTEGTDFTLRVYNAQGDASTLNSIAGTVSGEKWDLVMCTSTPTIQLLSKKLPGQKIVFTSVGDPIMAGLGSSFTSHLPNLTGISTMSDFEGMIRLVTALQPQIKILGTVYTPAEINSVVYRDNLEKAAKTRGLKLISSPANTAGEVLDAANALVFRNIDAFCQISDNLTGSSGSSILKVAGDRKIPYYGFTSGLINKGATAVCARDYFIAGYEAGQEAVVVLKGRSPEDIPFKIIGETSFAISKARAAQFGIKLRDDLNTKFPGIKIY